MRVASVPSPVPSPRRSPGGSHASSGGSGCEVTSTSPSSKDALIVQHSLQAGTLQELCWRVVKSHITANNVLDLLRFAEQFDMVPGFVNIRAHCMGYVLRAYEVLRERKGREELAAVVDAGTLARLEAAVEERGRVASGLKAVLGRVVELPPPPPSCEQQAPSVGGHAVSYPYSYLVAGVGWPAAVDPSARETHMCAAEFAQVFGMSWDAYCALPSWKRTVLKQQHRLF